MSFSLFQFYNLCLFGLVLLVTESTAEYETKCTPTLSCYPVVFLHCLRIYCVSIRVHKNKNTVYLKPNTIELQTRQETRHCWVTLLYYFAMYGKQESGLFQVHCVQLVKGTIEMQAVVGS